MRVLPVERPRLSAWFYHQIFLWHLLRQLIPCSPVLNSLKQLILQVSDSTICPLEKHIQGVSTSVLGHTQRTAPKISLRSCGRQIQAPQEVLSQEQNWSKVTRTLRRLTTNKIPQKDHIHQIYPSYGQFTPVAQSATILHCKFCIKMVICKKHILLKHPSYQWDPPDLSYHKGSVQGLIS